MSGSNFRLLCYWIVLAVAYAVFGKLALLLAIPPGYATAVWPAAGIAVAALLIWGNRLWPGVLLGSVLVNIWTSWDGGDSATIARSLGIAFSIGTGATIQALVGAALVRRFVGWPNLLDQERSILAFLGFAGPVASVAAATIGVVTLILAGMVPPNQGLINWTTWWVGDTIGVCLFAPLVFMAFAQPRDRWRCRLLGVALPTVAAFTLVVGLFYVASNHENNRLDQRFSDQAQKLNLAIKARLQSNFEVLEYLRDFYSSSNEVDRAEFSTFTKRALREYPGIKALEWVPRVAASQREAYELDQKIAGFDAYRIVERDASGTMTSAADRDYFYPVSFVEPLAGNEPALGFDLGSNASRHKTLAQACDTGMPIVTERIRLVQESDKQFGVLLVKPIYVNGTSTATVEDRRRNLQGFLVGVFRVGDMVNAALKDQDVDGIHFSVTDLAVAPEKAVLFSNGSSPGDGSTDANGLSQSVPLAVGGRTWNITSTATNEHAAFNRSWQPWLVLAGGLSLIVLLGAFLLVTSGRAVVVKRLVAEKTEELATLNSELDRRVRDRTQLLLETNEQLSLAVDEHAAAEARYEDLYERAPDMYFSIDAASGTVMECNQTLCNSLGIDRDQIIGKPICQLYHPDSVDEARAAFEVFQNTGEVRGVWLTLRRADGGEMDVSLNVTAIRDDSGRIIASRSVWRDVTELKKARDALQKSHDSLESRVEKRTAQLANANSELHKLNDDLARSNAELDDFAYIASHDLKEPLRGLNNYAAFLIEDYEELLDDDGKDKLHTIQRLTVRMEKLINSLLEFSRVGRVDMAIGPTDLQVILDEVIDSLKPRFETENVEVIVSRPMPTISCDRVRVAEVFRNLLTNAMKYNDKPAKQIEIGFIEPDDPETTGEDDYIFFVRDNGIGVPAQHMDKLFKLFKRLHGRNEYGGGTGAGLTIVKKIVERHQGSVWAESAVGDGTTFKFTLKKAA